MDESKFSRIGSDGHIYVRRRVHEAFASNCTVAALKGFGGSIMMWAAITANRPRPPMWLEGSITARKCCDILSEHFVPFANDHLPANYTFVQDNAPVHSA